MDAAVAVEVRSRRGRVDYLEAKEGQAGGRIGALPSDLEPQIWPFDTSIPCTSVRNGVNGWRCSRRIA